MPDELTDYQIVLLCDIQEGDLTKFAGDRKRDLERLLSEGYVEPTQSHPGSAFKFTGKGAEFAITPSTAIISLIASISLRSVKTGSE